MACKLTYKGQSFDDIRSLTRFINLERLQGSSSIDRENSMGFGIKSSYDATSEYGLEIDELYTNEEEVLTKFDACGR